MAITDVSYLAELRKRAQANYKLGMWQLGHSSIGPSSFSAVNIPTDNNKSDWESIVWSPKLEIFCCINGSTGYGATQTSMISSDGLTWTQHSNLSDLYNWKTLLWIPELEKFCAIGFRVIDEETNTIETSSALSSDGINWTIHPIAYEPNTLFYCAAWSTKYNKICAIVPYYSTRNLATSSDGINWTIYNVPALNPSSLIPWQAMTWSKKLEMFVVVGGGPAGNIATSPDGLTWTILSGVPNIQYYDVAFAEDLTQFVATGSQGAATSYDGVTWTNQPLLNSNWWASLTYCPELNLYYSIARGGLDTQRIAYATNGIDWVVTTGPSFNYSFQKSAWSPKLGVLCISLGMGYDSDTKNRILINYNERRLFHYKRVYGYA